MIERPNLSDESILACLRRSVPAAALAFLPLGNDASSWVYRVYLEGGESLFLKVRRGAPYLPGLLAPHYLRNHGFLEVIAPLPFVFFDPLAGLSTRQDAVDGVKALFDPGDVVEAAHRSVHGKS